jgi:hypothetical protein
MRRKVHSTEGKRIYARRKAIVEPVFGQAKEVRGLRRLSMRGLAQARSEWAIICMTHNLLKLYRQLAGQALGGVRPSVPALSMA